MFLYNLNANKYSIATKEVIYENKKRVTFNNFYINYYFAKTSYSKQESTYITKYVSSGETLWSIAKYEVENNNIIKTKI